MVNTSILSGVALATLINVVVVTASKKPSSLDTTVWTANNTNLIPEEEFDFDQGSSIAERKKCLATRQCTNAGGSCIKSSAYCDGTVDLQGCKGNKCKCCIPNQTTATTPSPTQDTTTTAESLEVKVHNLETELRSMVVNLTVSYSNLMTLIMSANSNLDLKIDYINSNFTDANSYMKNELQFIKENLTNANAHLDSKLDSLKEGQEQTTLTQATCPTTPDVTTTLSVTTTPVVTTTPDVTTTQVFTTTPAGCNSNGLFKFNPSNQCFKFLDDKRRNWQEADTRCRLEGLQLAKPANPNAILKHLVTVLGSTDHVFIGARGDGSSFKWQGDGQTISNSDPNWWSGKPGTSYSTSHCLVLVAHSNGISQGKAYYPHRCADYLNTLCELV